MKAVSTFDVIIVGGGHAGTEAALASARIGANTLLLTQNIETLGQLSCNPSIGGIGKSQLVREIDALGGAMALAADRSGIQFRVLNSRKGPAVRATRVQVDRQLYKQAIRETLENQANLSIFQQPVIDLILADGKAQGVITQLGMSFYAKSIVLTAGTFLNGKIHVGLSHHAGGRAGDAASTSLTERLHQLPFRMGRLKTGTPPRLDRRTINYDGLEEQLSEAPLPAISAQGDASRRPEQRSCFVTHTNEATHQLVRDNLNQSPIYTGHIQSMGPRYCPSFETKVVRFSDKKSHQVYLEPEGLHAQEIYPNGISTSLPFQVQVDLVHSIKGLESAHITRPGYAVEYDFFDPRDLFPSLESKLVPHLFFAGQINGTTGYEEAAAQGVIAGINAALKAKNESSWWPRRDQAYIGVLVDDLVTQGTIEPYRMFTSRAEHRLLLREDNADLRLTPLGYDLGVVSSKQWQLFSKKKALFIQEQLRLANYWVQPQTALANKINALLIEPLHRETHLLRLLTRSELTYQTLMSLPEIGPGVSEVAVQAQIEIEARYGGYIELQKKSIQKQLRRETTTLPLTIDYHLVHGLSNEVREILIQHKPLTIGQAERIPGMTPAAISVLLVFLKKHRSQERNAV